MNRLSQNKLFTGIFGVATLLVLLASIAPQSAEASSQSFSVLDDKVKTGMLVSLTLNSGVVEPASDKNATSLLGIISNNTSDISYSPAPGKVSVQTDGEAMALVSTLGGDVLIGDRIAPSSLAGVGQKTDQSGWIVGTAQASLDSKTTGAVTTTVTDSKGKKHKVYVSSIPVIIHVTYYTVPGTESSQSASVLPTKIQAVANAIAGKQASIVGLVLSFLLLLIGVVTAGIIVNSTVKGSFVAIARQPLSKASVLKMLIRSLAVAGVIIVVVLLGAFVILRIL